MLKLKEPLNGWLHLIGAVLAIPAMIILIIKSTSAWQVTAFAIYGATLFLLYLFSTLYHWLPKNAGGKYQVFRKLDHLAIYALIAGTYTPFCLVTLRGGWGWTLFGLVWGIALTGMILQAIYINLPRWLTTSAYVLMGWLIVIGLKPLINNLSVEGFKWLMAGGLVYSIGGIIYTIKKPNLFKGFGYHELWHCFVLGGSVLHFFAMLYVL